MQQEEPPFVGKKAEAALTELAAGATMETQLWAIAIKGDQSASALKTEVGSMATVSPFKVPVNQLRVGTLDSLMSLSDDLSKMDVLSEATVTKMYKQLQELKPDADGPTIIGGELLLQSRNIFPRAEAAAAAAAAAAWQSLARCAAGAVAASAASGQREAARRTARACASGAPARRRALWAQGCGH